MEAGKHVMSEKPMAKTAADALRMLEASKRTGKKLTVGYNNRFRGDSQALKAIVDGGELGDIYYAKAHAIRRRAVPTWGVFLDEEKQGGGPLIDIGTHALDLTLWMMDNYKPKVVLGTAYHKLSQRQNAANAWGPWDPAQFTVEDSAFGMIVMENGATIVLESSWALNTLEVDEAKCTLSGTEGGADMKGGLRINGEQNSRLFTKEIELNSGGVAFYDGKAENAADLEMKMWIKAIEEDKDPVVTPEQAYVVSQILEAIYESSKTGKAIYL
jgi:predicted dehydrogenase